MAGDRVEQALALAREARAHAYAPYSGVPDGCVVSDLDGVTESARVGDVGPRLPHKP
jgi:cytidine deaminase